MIVAVVFGTLALGVLIGHMWNDHILLAQEIAHKKQMDEMGKELKRAYAQVANLIGKEKC